MLKIFALFETLDVALQIASDFIENAGHERNDVAEGRRFSNWPPVIIPKVTEYRVSFF